MDLQSNIMERIVENISNAQYYPHQQTLPKIAVNDNYCIIATNHYCIKLFITLWQIISYLVRVSSN